MKFRNLTYAFLLFAALAMGQEQAQYTQYMYNTIAINPGYTGTTENMEAMLLHRTQWTGIEGSPLTSSLGLHQKVSYRLGLGLNLLTDQLGPSNKTLFNGTVAYEIPTGALTKLSFGMNVGFDLLRVDWSRGTFFDANDPRFAEDVNSFSPIVGAGAFWYSNQWYLGLSANNFLNSEIYDNNNPAVLTKRTQYYFMGGYVFDMSPSLKFKPTLLTKHVTGAPITVDVSANFLFKEKLTLGSGYRFNDAFSALAGFQVSQKFFLGYSYDQTFTALNGFNSGTHELILRYSARAAQRAISPRFF